MDKRQTFIPTGEDQINNGPSFSLQINKWQKLKFL